jgi:hypothetical protein
MQCRVKVLLHALGARLGVDQSFEDGEDVAAVFDHAREEVAQRGLALGLAMPHQQNSGGDFNVPAKLRGGVPAQEQAVKEGRFPLREVEVAPGFFDRLGGGGNRRVGFSLHQRLKTEKAVYRKFIRRQVVLLYQWPNI